MNFASLFSGCGGFDLGFIESGYKSVGSYDIDSNVLEVLHKNLDTPIHQLDLSDGVIPYKEDVDVLLAGSPCQGFSTVGKRRINDSRNQLLISAGKIAVQVKPKVFIAENVPGVIAGKHKKYWNELHDILRQNGYHTAEYFCEGTDTGVAQIRKRILTIAWRDGKDIQIELPKSNALVLKDVIRNINGSKNHNIKTMSDDSKEILIAKRIKPGQKLSNVRSGPRAIHTWDIPEVFGKINLREKNVLETILKLRRQMRVRDYGDADPVPKNILESEFGSKILESLLQKSYIKSIDDCYDLTHTFNGKYRRLSWDKPSYTVDTRFGNPKYYLHPTKNRGFTVREAARIQGFPDNFIFYGTESEQYRMVGNAVPPPMSKTIAKFIKECFLQ